MEGKILLFDENDAPMGATFMRRARQLVNQQRASWVDESRSAIRFVSGADGAEDFTAEAAAKAKPELYALAKKRIAERQRFYIHTAVCAFITMFCLIAADDRMYQVWNGGYHGSALDFILLMYFVTGFNAALYAVHAWIFSQSRLAKYNAEKLKKEMNKLKRLETME